MKNGILLFCLFGLLSIPNFTQAAPATVGDDIVGTWTYEVPYAPPGYEKGELVFTKDGDKLTGKIVFMDGTALPIENLKVEDGKLTGGISVEDAYVTFNLNVDGESMKGVVATPDGDLDMSAKKKA